MTLSLRPATPQAPARRPLRIRHALALRCSASPAGTALALSRSTSCTLVNGFTPVPDDQDQQVASTA